MATTRLLAALHARGAELRYHGDFDRQGLRIATDVFRVGARPWRFGATDNAARRYPHLQLPALDAQPSLLAAGWDHDLVATMAVDGLAVEEEYVLEVLSPTWPARWRRKP